MYPATSIATTTKYGYEIGLVIVVWVCVIWFRQFFPQSTSSRAKKNQVTWRPKRKFMDTSDKEQQTICILRISEEFTVTSHKNVLSSTLCTIRKSKVRRSP